MTITDKRKWTSNVMRRIKEESGNLGVVCVCECKGDGGPGGGVPKEHLQNRQDTSLSYTDWQRVMMEQETGWQRG